MVCWDFEENRKNKHKSILHTQDEKNIQLKIRKGFHTKANARTRRVATMESKLVLQNGLSCRRRSRSEHIFFGCWNSENSLWYVCVSLFAVQCSIYFLFSFHIIFSISSFISIEKVMFASAWMWWITHWTKQEWKNVLRIKWNLMVAWGPFQCGNWLPERGSPLYRRINQQKCHIFSLNETIRSSQSLI